MVARAGEAGGFPPRVASDSLCAEKRIHEALATPGWPGVRKIAARFWRQSWDSAADHPPFRRAKHRHPLAMAGRSPVSIETVCCFGLCGCTARQPHREHGALARLARHRHVTRHHARELAGDGKAEPRAAEALGGRGIGLAELLEQLGLLLRSHANAGVSDCELDPLAPVRHLAHPQSDLALLRELA